MLFARASSSATTPRIASDSDSQAMCRENPEACFADTSWIRPSVELIAQASARQKWPTVRAALSSDHKYDEDRRSAGGPRKDSDESELRRLRSRQRRQGAT